MILGKLQTKILLHVALILLGQHCEGVVLEAQENNARTGKNPVHCYLNCGLLAKLRYYVKLDLLRTVYFAVFHSIMRYGLQVWDQNKSTTFKEIENLQNKAIRIMCFKSKLEPAKPLYRDFKILKIRDLLTLINCQFEKASMTGKLEISTNVTLGK